MAARKSMSGRAVREDGRTMRVAALPRAIAHVGPARRHTNISRASASNRRLRRLSCFQLSTPNLIFRSVRSAITMASSSKAPLNPSGHRLPLMIHVTAPATLPAGYTFEAQINGDESKMVLIEVVRGINRWRLVPCLES